MSTRTLSGRNVFACCYTALALAAVGPAQNSRADFLLGEWNYGAEAIPSQNSDSGSHPLDNSAGAFYDPASLSLDHSSSVDNFQATFHVHTSVSGFGAPFDGDYGTPGSPYVSLTASGSGAGHAQLGSDVMATHILSLTNDVTIEIPSITHIVEGHVAPGDEVILEVSYDASGLMFGIDKDITTSGDFQFTFTNPDTIGAGGAVSWGLNYELVINRAAGDHEASSVAVIDPPPGSAVNGVSQVPEPSSIALLGMGGIGLALAARRSAGSRSS